MTNHTVLVIGGAGYVGSHTARLLSQRQYDVKVLDNLSTGHRNAVRFCTLIEGDYTDKATMVRVFREQKIDTVLHFGARAVVPESVENPLLYHERNVAGTVHLASAMVEAGVKYFVFSSTCAIYGDPRGRAISEDLVRNPVTPYGRGKLYIEEMIRDIGPRHGFSSVILRYFNAAGADPSGEIGEAHDPETHLIPLAVRAALGGTPLTLYGSDYPTPDGTCLRDYVHVNDLADAHVLAMEWLWAGKGENDFNLGTTKGTSVRELLKVLEQIHGGPVPHRMGPRRPGDPAMLVADAKKAREVLGWNPKRSLEETVRSAYQWEKLKAKS